MRTQGREAGGRQRTAIWGDEAGPWAEARVTGL